MVYAGLSLPELVSQAEQQCQKVEAEADSAFEVATNLAEEARQTSTNLEAASQETLNKLQSLQGTLEQTEQELNDLEQYQSEIAALSQQVEEVTERVEGTIDEINSELATILNRISELGASLMEAVPPIQQEIMELVQTAQTQVGQIAQQEVAVISKGSELQLQVQVALQGLIELQGELNERLSELGQTLTEDKEVFSEHLNSLLEGTQQQLSQLIELIGNNTESSITELKNSVLQEAYREIDGCLSEFQEKLGELLERSKALSESTDKQLANIIDRIADNLEILNPIKALLESVT